MTLTEFVQAQNIKIDAFFLGKKKSEDKWEHFEWRVDLVNMQGRHSLTSQEIQSVPRHSLTYKKGMAHVGYPPNRARSEWLQATEKEIKFSIIKAGREPKPIPPSLIEVVASLHMECVGIANTPLWEDWASEFGYNVDSIKDKKIFDTVTAQYLELRKFFGNKFQEFLECENDH